MILLFLKETNDSYTNNKHDSVNTTEKKKQFNFYKLELSINIAMTFVCFFN